MDNQLHTIVCPNCGANATNFKNCEYCGSLLVRFASTGNEQALSAFNNAVNSLDERIVNAIAKILSLSIFSEKDSQIAATVYPGSEYQNFGPFINYENGCMYLELDSEYNQTLAESYSSIPDAMLSLFQPAKSNQELNYRLYRLDLGNDYKSAAAIWFELLQHAANKEHLVWNPERLVIENKYGQYNCYGDKIGDKTDNEFGTEDEIIEWTEKSSEQLQRQQEQQRQLKDAEAMKSNRRLIIGLIVGIIAIISGIIFLFTEEFFIGIALIAGGSYFIKNAFSGGKQPE